MSVDRSLKSSTALTRHRSVLTRAERIQYLTDEDRWDEAKDSVFGLPKVIHRKSSAGKRAKKEKEENEVGTDAVAVSTEETSESST